jgi:hypothetical protein
LHGHVRLLPPVDEEVYARAQGGPELLVAARYRNR